VSRRSSGSVPTRCRPGDLRALAFVEHFAVRDAVGSCVTNPAVNVLSQGHGIDLREPS
jgi:hypothetical protein